MAADGKAGLTGVSARGGAKGGALPANGPAALAAVAGPLAIGAGAGAVCVEAAGEVVGVGCKGGGEEEQPARNATAPAIDSLNRRWNNSNRNSMAGFTIRCNALFSFVPEVYKRFFNANCTNVRCTNARGTNGSCIFEFS